MTKRYLVLLTCLAAGLSSPVLAQPVGPEFQVNTFTTSIQQSASVASDASGNFVVVWIRTDVEYFGIFGQRYDSSGKRLGGEFQVTTEPFPKDPSVASDASGNFVVVWVGGSGCPICGQRYDGGGNPVGSEFTVVDEPGYHYSTAVGSDATGHFVVVWEKKDGGVFGQRYDNDGQPLGDKFLVKGGNQYHPQLSLGPNGTFVVVWTDQDDRRKGGDGSQAGAFGQRYDSDGNALDGPFQVNTYTTGYQSHPAVAADADGNFLVVWQSRGQDGSRDGIFGQRYNSGGNPLGSEFPVNSYTTGLQTSPSVASDSDGRFVVVWQSWQQDGSAYGVFGQRYDSGGNSLGGEFQVNTYTTSYQLAPSLAADASGNFVVVWSSLDQDGSDLGIFGQRYSAACEASIRVHGDVHAPGSMIPIQVHIAHHRPKTVTVPWELRLTDANGQWIVRHVTEPHTFEPGDVVDRDVQFQLPDDLASGTYTLELAITGMAGTNGATTTLQVVRDE